MESTTESKEAPTTTEVLKSDSEKELKLNGKKYNKKVFRKKRKTNLSSFGSSIKMNSNHLSKLSNTNRPRRSNIKQLVGKSISSNRFYNDVEDRL